jgi:cytochrome c oxidase subunit 3
LSAGIAGQFRSRAAEADAARFGLWIFLATEVLFFGPLFMGYVYGRMHLGDAFAAASRHTDVTIGTLNTAVLLTSSFTMAMAAEARRAGARAARGLLAATALLGCAFLALKGFEYHAEWREHLVPGASFAFDAAHVRGAEIFYYLYFAMTGVHAVHLAVGITIVIASAVRFDRASPGHVELAGLYWHFVDAIWIFLYPMLYLVGRAG